MRAGCNQIPVIGWMWQFVLAVSLSVPFWFFWNVAGIGATYFYWLPETYQRIPFWDCVGIAVVVSILKYVLVPRLASVSNSNSVTNPKSCSTTNPKSSTEAER